MWFFGAFEIQQIFSKFWIFAVVVILFVCLFEGKNAPSLGAEGSAWRGEGVVK